MEQLQKTNKNISVKKSSFFFVFTLGVYFVLNLIFSVILGIKLPKNTTITDYYGKKIWFTCLNYGLFPISFILVYVLYCINNKEKNFYVLKPEKLHIKYVPFIIAISFGFMFGFFKINDYFVEFLEKYTNYTSSTTILPNFSVVNFVLCTIFIAVLPAVCEELLFRKIILFSLNNYSVLAKILISACLFAFFHMSPAQTIYQFLFGCVFAITVIFTQSCLSSILMHFLNNFFILVIYYSKTEFTKTTTIVLTIIGLVLVFACVILALINIFKRKEQKNKLDKQVLYLAIPFFICLLLWVVQL